MTSALFLRERDGFGLQVYRLVPSLARQTHCPSGRIYFLADLIHSAFILLGYRNTRIEYIPEVLFHANSTFLYELLLVSWRLGWLTSGAIKYSVRSYLHLSTQVLLCSLFDVGVL